ncbi:hypothetical protein K402DRAFT_98474 [Aulographum hederae CBS 113979]|uniref:Uncharacterized protein n=1 Tax=Aulographum hederae CBS 113979 TaxID=1176131 RepID=A0A6G1GZ24_9PEZI|nr:hypothetical protein K402DRAFT_98474 [Aulographum hederae CBS 113979]
MGSVHGNSSRGNLQEPSIEGDLSNPGFHPLIVAVDSNAFTPGASLVCFKILSLQISLHFLYTAFSGLWLSKCSAFVYTHRRASARGNKKRFEGYALYALWKLRSKLGEVHVIIGCSALRGEHILFCHQRSVRLLGSSSSSSSSSSLPSSPPHLQPLTECSAYFSLPGHLQPLFLQAFSTTDRSKSTTKVFLYCKLS